MGGSILFRHPLFPPTTGGVLRKMLLKMAPRLPKTVSEKPSSVGPHCMLGETLHMSIVYNEYVYAYAYIYP